MHDLRRQDFTASMQHEMLDSNGHGVLGILSKKHEGTAIQLLIWAGMISPIWNE